MELQSVHSGRFLNVYGGGHDAGTKVSTSHRLLNIHPLPLSPIPDHLLIAFPLSLLSLSLFLFATRCTCGTTRWV